MDRKRSEDAEFTFCSPFQICFFFFYSETFSKDISKKHANLLISGPDFFCTYEDFADSRGGRENVIFYFVNSSITV